MRYLLGLIALVTLSACNPYTYQPHWHGAPAGDTYSTCAEQPSAPGNEFCAGQP